MKHKYNSINFSITISIKIILIFAYIQIEIMISYILPFSNNSQGACSSTETFQFNTFINKRRKERKGEGME